MTATPSTPAPRSRTLVVRGHKIRSASARRYVVVAVRPDVWVDPTTGETYAAFARIQRRSDSHETAQTAARRLRDSGHRGYGLVVVVVDQTTGEEV